MHIYNRKRLRINPNRVPESIFSTWYLLVLIPSVLPLHLPLNGREFVLRLTFCHSWLSGLDIMNTSLHLSGTNIMLISSWRPPDIEILIVIIKKGIPSRIRTVTLHDYESPINTLLPWQTTNRPSVTQVCPLTRRNSVWTSRQYEDTLEALETPQHNVTNLVERGTGR